jgi:hypothetical protein
VFESVPELGVAEEVGDADEGFFLQGSEFIGAGLEETDVLGEGVDAEQNHTAGDAPAEGLLLVEAELETGDGAEHAEDANQIFIFEADAAPGIDAVCFLKLADIGTGELAGNRWSSVLASAWGAERRARGAETSMLLTGPGTEVSEAVSRARGLSFGIDIRPS